MDVLVYCFRPYQGLDSNPSELLAEELLDKDTETDFSVLRLESCYSESEQLLHKIDEVEPDLVLGLGADPNVGKVQIEKLAVNFMDKSLEDECGVEKREERIVENGETAFETGFPVSQLREYLEKREIPATVSYHADTFVCNKIYYESLRHCLKRPTEAVFVHLPLRPDQEKELDRELPSLKQENLAGNLSEFLTNLYLP